MSSRTPRYQLRHEGKEIEIHGSCVVGREADCNLMLDGALVSRHHARFTESRDSLVVEDLGSRNGVFVNQRRIRERTPLSYGDLVGIGLATLEVMDPQVVPRRKRETLPAPFAKSDVDGPEQVTVTTRLDVLTEREREVFELIVLGHGQREIAAKLFVSVKTIETHRAHIAEKLCCRTRAELVAYAINAGLLRKGA